jgi:predicted nucleic acid-binding protein
MTSNRILPDTCAWIDFFNGRHTVLAHALEQVLVQGEAVTCGVVLYELVQGIRNKKEESLVLNALQALPHLEMTDKQWIIAGRLSAALRKRGQTLPFSDIIIATLALEHKITILTIDHHFSLVPGLVTVTGV